MKLSPLALAVALLPFATHATATDAATDSSEALLAPALVVTSGRQVEAKKTAVAATSVFTRADIERLQVRNVDELLTRVPGVSVSRNGGPGSLTGVFMRGTASAQSLILVDGQRIAAASSGTTSLEFLSIDQIERIEVVRGSRSSLYGSDAIGGVIQIFTRRGGNTPAQPYMRLAAGSNNTYERTLGISGGDAQTRYNLSGSLNESQGIDNTGSHLGDNRDDDALRNRALSMNVSHQLNEQLEVGISALDQRGQTEFDDLLSGTRPYEDFQLSSTSGYLSAQLNDSWLSRIDVGHSEDKRDTKNDDPQGALYNYNSYRNAANWLNTLQVNDTNKLLVGLDWYEDILHSSTVFNETSRWNQAAFIQHRFYGEQFSTELGMRHDKNEDFGSQNTWNGALTVPVNADNETILSYSEGFRAPTFNDLYNPWFANPNLDPEHSKTYEAQWRNRFSSTSQLELSLYRTDLKDAIVSDQNYIPQNVQRARINGFEAALAQRLGDWQANLALGLIDPRDRDTGHTLQRRAKRTLTLDLDRQFGALSAGGTWRAVAGRYDDADNNVEMGGYGLLGVRAGWQASKEVSFDVKLDNLLDKDYADATYSNAHYNYNTEGRTVLFAVTWTPEL
ncbi:MAG: TonB-dependent receptor [Pseudomonas sp.]|nr:TonB-dependent receptor [Pseudomonas sp.]